MAAAPANPVPIVPQQPVQPANPAVAVIPAALPRARYDPDWRDPQVPLYDKNQHINDQKFAPDEEVLFSRNDVWAVPHISNINRLTVTIGQLKGGKVIPDTPEFDINSIATLYIHFDYHYCGTQKLDVRYFLKNEAAKRIPSWKIALINGGVIAGSDATCMLHWFANQQRKCLRCCFDIDSDGFIIFYMTLNASKVQETLADAEAEIKVSCSLTLLQKSPVYIYNQSLPLAYPHLKTMRVYRGRHRWTGKNQYIESPESGDETDDESIPPADDNNGGGLKSILSSLYFPYDVYHKPREPKVDFEDFYDRISRRREKPPDYELSVDKLTCTLRPYQVEAVQFMMHREIQTEIVLKDDIFRTVDIDGGLYYYPEFGIFAKSKEKPKLKVTGGILADEMGLGKTVELLALIFSCRPDNIDKLTLRSTRSRPLTPVDPVKECLDYVVSSVASQEDGIQGLNSILKSKLIRPDTRNKNVYFNTNSRHYMMYKNLDHLPKIQCAECGISCLRDKMHWKDEYEREGIPFVCPDCVFDGPKLPSGATLIIVPQILIHQWFEEIRKHIRDDVKIDVYMGVEKDGYKHPVYLSRCDIVITSYEVLRHELEYCQPGTIHNLRKRTYDQQRQVTTPLIAIAWWRICLDESQMIEGWGKMASRMVAKLSGRARWCVTGTPLMKGPDDFYGLVCFLDLYPFTIRNVWFSQLWFPFCERRKNRIIDFVATFFWRNTVKGVQEQLRIPPIQHDVTELHFSPLEERLYQDQLTKCLDAVNKYISFRPHQAHQKLCTINDADQKDIMGMFNKLRLFILTGGSHVRSRRREQTIGSIVYSAEVLFRRLFTTHRTKLEEQIRECVYAICALGGLKLLYRVGEAKHAYLQLADIERIMQNVNRTLVQHLPEKMLHIDRTQMVHFCRAMIDLQMNSDENVPPVEHPYTRDVLERRMLENQNEYTRREIANLKKLYDDWKTVEVAWRKYDFGFECSLQWILVYLDAMKPHQLDDLRTFLFHSELVMAQDIQHMWEEFRHSTFPYRVFFYIKDYLERQNGNIMEMRRKLSQCIFPYNPRTNQFNFNMDDEEFCTMLECQHNAMYIGKDSSELAEKDDDEGLDNLINQDRATTRSTFKLIVGENYGAYSCALCDLEKTVIALEKALEMRTGDMRIPLEHNEWYIFLKEVANKRIGGTGHSHCIQLLWKWFEQSRKTVLISHKTIVAMKEVVCRYRELRQAQKRLQLDMRIELPGFLAPTLLLTGNGNDNRISGAITSWTMKVAECKDKIVRIQNQIGYIATLNDDQDNPERRQCPVCFEYILHAWNVLPCAHFICPGCFTKMRTMIQDDPATGKKLCVACRAPYSLENCMQVIDSGPERDAIPGIANHLNVKYDAVVRKLLNILTDITSKVLVFSSLPESLDTFCSVLQQANIRFNRLFYLDPLKVATFRNDPQIRVLVIPMNTGASGLNLTQANHVIFLEPSIEKATVAQAIGRMARMGQTRAMTVHNFVVMGSLEEEVHRLANDVISDDGWTLHQMKELLEQAAVAHNVV